MAKGKQAAAAATRRAEAAHSHIDRLTSELVDAKMRARQCEQAVIHLPQVQEALRVAERERDEATSGEVRRLNEMLAAMRDERDEAVALADKIQNNWKAILKKVLDTSGRKGVENLEWLVEIMGAPDGVTLTDGGAEQKFSARHGSEALRSLQRARGLRS